MVRRELAILYILYYCTYNVLHCAKATQQRPLLFFWHELSLPPGISGFITGAKGFAVANANATRQNIEMHQ